MPARWSERRGEPSGHGGDGSADRIWSVSEFSRSLKGILESSFGRLRIRGQVSGLAKPPSGHVYFSLVDDRPALGSRSSSSQVGAVMWRSSVARMKFDLEDGMKIVVTGKVTVYEPRSVYQLVAERIEPEGVGDLQVAFEQLKAKLAEEGLFDEDRKRELPFFPRRVGLVTSPTGAAVLDFLRILEERNPGAQVRLVPVRVQGDGAAAEIAAAVDLLSREEADVDVIVVTRGGGSLEDLWAFNEEPVARAVARAAKPVVSAVGHEVDFTIADFVADARAPTPTAAASFVSPNFTDLRSRLEASRRALVSELRTRAQDGAHRLARAAAGRVFSDPQLVVQERFGALDGALEGLQIHLYNRMRECHDSLTLLSSRLRALSPFAILERGYSVALDPQGRPIRRASDLSRDDLLDLRLAGGSAQVRVEQVFPSEGFPSEKNDDSERAETD